MVQQESTLPEKTRQTKVTKVKTTELGWGQHILYKNIIIGLQSLTLRHFYLSKVCLKWPLQTLLYFYETCSRKTSIV